MRTIKLTIEYDGTDFNGWQVQSQGNRTVQGEIEKALQTILKKKVRVYGSGRTDSGVHALGQVAHFKTSSTIPADAICRALNVNLPRDVAILQAEDVKRDFHAQFDAKRKVYRYTILNRQKPCAVNRRFCTHIPYALNVSAMRRGAKDLIGQHDFRSFVASDPAKCGKEGSTIRRIYRADLKKRGMYIVFEIEANGFLYKMVRNIVGTLIAIGARQCSSFSMQNIITAKNRTMAGDTALPQGLCLMEVKYA